MGSGLFMRARCASADQCASQKVGPSSLFAGLKSMLVVWTPPIPSLWGRLSL